MFPRITDSRVPGRARTLTVTSTLAGLLVLCTLSGTASGADDDDEGHNWRLHGRIQADSAWYDSDNPLYLDDAGIRRARIALLGDLWSGWRMKVEYEFTGSTPGPKSIYLRHDLGENGTVTFGHFKESVSLQASTSSRYNTFMERALPNADSPGYRLGAKFSTYGDNWSATTGITGGRLTDKHDVESDGTGVYFRGVFNPIAKRKEMWHIGFGAEARSYGSTDTVRLRSRPESDMTDVRMVDTGTIVDPDMAFRYTAELAWKHRSLHAQAEYLSLNLSRKGGAEDLGFSGWYAQVGWFITGEARTYDRKSGSFGRIKPKNGYGAWEVAVRVSDINLNDGDIAGGTERNNALALNWYATKSMRVSLNYIDASARPAQTGLDDDVSIVQARLQYIF